jgi:hypothetical protein
MNTGGGREGEKREGESEGAGWEGGRNQSNDGDERRVAQQSTRSVAPRAVSAPLPCPQRWTSARTTSSAASTRTSTRGQAESTAGSERERRERGRRAEGERVCPVKRTAADISTGRCLAACTPARPLLRAGMESYISHN